MPAPSEVVGIPGYCGFVSNSVACAQISGGAPLSKELILPLLNKNEAGSLSALRSIRISSPASARGPFLVGCSLSDFAVRGKGMVLACYLPHQHGEAAQHNLA